MILAAGGLLDGRRATSHWMAVPTLKAFGVTPVGDEHVVVAEGPGNGVVTAAGVSAVIDLGLWLAGQLGGEAKAKSIQLAIEYDPHPPFDSGHLSKASVATKAAATAMLSKDLMNPANSRPPRCCSGTRRSRRPAAGPGGDGNKCRSASVAGW